MNHWQIIALAYALTFAALAVEVALLFRRRRGALRQAQAWLDTDEVAAPPGAGAGSPGDGASGSSEGSGDARARAGAGAAS